MIICQFKQLTDYQGMHKNLDRAIDWIQKTDLASLPMGRTEVDGALVFVNRFDYQTRPEEDLLFESHLVYADIHLLLSGQEKILVSQLDSLTTIKVDPELDNIDANGPGQVIVHMNPDTLLLVFPGEAHKVKCLHQAACQVKKAVVKVRI